MKSFCFFLLLICSLWTLGCAGGESKEQLTGTVELDKAALPEGDITFEPITKGIAAEGAKITNGKYSVAIARGKYKVMIRAFKKVPLGPGEPSVSGEKDKLVPILGPEYNDKSGLTAEVTGPTPIDFKLSSPKFNK